MKKLILLLVLLTPTAVLAEPDLDKFFVNLVEFCKVTGKDKPIVGYVCPVDVKTVDQCRKTGEQTGEVSLSQCVIERLTKEEREVWAKSKFNPTVKQ